MAEEQVVTQEVPTFTKEQLDAAVKEARAGQDRFVQEVQDGRQIPKWVKDAGYDSAEAALAALKRTPAADGPAKRTQPAQAPDITKYVDESGNLSGQNLARYMADVQADNERRMNELLSERELAVAMQAETAHIADLAKRAPDVLVKDDPEGEEIVAAALEGLVARRSKKDAPMSRDEIAAQRAALEGYIGRVVDREVARRAAEADEARKNAPPAHKPPTGDGQPSRPEPEARPTRPGETRQSDLEKSRAAFAERHKAT